MSNKKYILREEFKKNGIDTSSPIYAARINYTGLYSDKPVKLTYIEKDGCIFGWVKKPDWDFEILINTIFDDKNTMIDKNCTDFKMLLDIFNIKNKQNIYICKDGFGSKEAYSLSIEPIRIFIAGAIATMEMLTDILPRINS